MKSPCYRNSIVRLFSFESVGMAQRSMHPFWVTKSCVLGAAVGVSKATWLLTPIEGYLLVFNYSPSLLIDNFSQSSPKVSKARWLLTLAGLHFSGRCWRCTVSGVTKMLW